MNGNRSCMFHGRCIYVCIGVYVYSDTYGYAYISSSIPGFELRTVLLWTKDKVVGRLCQIHGYKHMCLYIYIYAYLCIHMCLYIYLCMRVYICTHTSIHIHIYIYIYTYTYCHIFDSVGVCVCCAGCMCVLCIPMRYVTSRIGPCLMPNS